MLPKVMAPNSGISHLANIPLSSNSHLFWLCHPSPMPSLANIATPADRSDGFVPAVQGVISDCHPRFLANSFNS